jgi:hypothetical protein
MTGSDGFYQIILFFVYLAGTYAYRMSNDRDRVISITLSESEWQAFVARQPQPVTWLRDRIREELKASAETKSAAAA